MTLAGLLVGSGLARALGDSQFTCWAAFTVLTAVHVWANYLGVGGLALVTINGQRAWLLSRAWLTARAREGVLGAAAGSAADRLGRRAPLSPASMAPEQVAAAERPWGPLARWLRGPRLGVGIGALLEPSEDGRPAAVDPDVLRELAGLYCGREYLLRVGADGAPRVALRPEATGRTALRAVLHATLLTEFERGSAGLWHAAPGGELAARPERAAEPPGRGGGRGGGGCGMGAREAEALEAALAAADAEWPRFAEAVERHGWKEAALGMDGLEETRVTLSLPAVARVRGAKNKRA